MGAAYRYPLARYFVPYARLSVGFDWATLSVGTDALLQRVGHPSVTGLAGFTIPIISVKDQGVLHDWVIFDLGVGYALRPSYAFSALARPEQGSPAVDPIARAPVDLGKLGLSGITYRIGLSLWL